MLRRPAPPKDDATFCSIFKWEVNSHTDTERKENLEKRVKSPSHQDNSCFCWLLPCSLQRATFYLAYDCHLWSELSPLAWKLLLLGTCRDLWKNMFVYLVLSGPTRCQWERQTGLGELSRNFLQPLILVEGILFPRRL